MVQLHGGYGCMLEYPVARAFVDYRVNRICGGTSEVQRELIARKLQASPWRAPGPHRAERLEPNVRPDPPDRRTGWASSTVWTSSSTEHARPSVIGGGP
jgi:hypothetical protein